MGEFFAGVSTTSLEQSCYHQAGSTDSLAQPPRTSRQEDKGGEVAGSPGGVGSFRVLPADPPSVFPFLRPPAPPGQSVCCYWCRGATVAPPGAWGGQWGTTWSIEQERRTGRIAPHRSGLSRCDRVSAEKMGYWTFHWFSCEHIKKCPFHTYRVLNQI